MAAFVLHWQSQKYLLFTIRPFTEKAHQPLLKPVSPAAQSKHTARLGASLEVTWGQDFPWRLAEVAKSSGYYVVSM